MQAPILCELAAFVAARTPRGAAVADAYARMAAAWATQIRSELDALRVMPAHSRDEAGRIAEKQSVLQRSAAFSSALVVLALSFAPSRHAEMTADGTVPPGAALQAIEDAAWAHDMAEHLILARFYRLPSGGAADARTRQHDGVWERVLATAAEMAPLWGALVDSGSGLLDGAAQVRLHTLSHVLRA